MNKKVFPINTETACQYKWTWSTIYLSHGQTNSCHRVNGGHLNATNFKDFHNLPEKIKDRELMLEGKWPNNECNYCKRIEDAGGISERTGYINDLDMVPPELETDPTAVHVTPRILEIYFSNLCNQSCVYCSPLFSSVIETEIKKHGPISKRYFLDGTWSKNALYETWKKQFWEWMHENSTNLYDFQVLGGEPMYQPEFQECLDFFETHENPNLNWKIFSNLKHDHKKFKKYIDKIAQLIKNKKIRRFEMVCSIDCWGEEQEYARNGMTLKNWEENFNYLLQQESDFSIFIQSTISPITAPTAYQLVDKVVEWRKIRSVRQGWNVVANPPFLDPSIFGYYLTEYMNKLVQSTMPLRNAGPDFPDISYLDGFATQIKNSEVNKEMLKELRNYLDELDSRRNQDWRKIYPWMDKIFIKELGNK
jgi:organic radical activating enzyme